MLVLFRDAHALFRSPSGMRRAIDRYEQCWLPLLKTHGKTPLVPPADVEYVWYCHAISGAYERDCAGLASTYAPILESEAQWSATMNRTRQLWEDAYLKNASHTCCHEPFHLTGSNVATSDAKRPAVKVQQLTTAHYCILLLTTDFTTRLRCKAPDCQGTRGGRDISRFTAAHVPCRCFKYT